MRPLFAAALLFIGLATASAAQAQELSVKYLTGADLSRPEAHASYWNSAAAVDISLMAQPMINPRPKETTTATVSVRSVHDGKWVAFLLKWKDTELSEAGKLGQFSDAAALQFPIKDKEVPPPILMGAKGDPVHLFHWRAQYQRDMEVGKPRMKDIYPNLNIDSYPMDYPDWGSYRRSTKAERDQFSPGIASGNPQAYRKTGVDEIYAEGFSTSSVQEGHNSRGHGEYRDGEWNLVIARPLAAEGGSVLVPGKNSFIAFAIWQGGKGEVGSRKCVTMTWTSLAVEPIGGK